MLLKLHTFLFLSSFSMQAMDQEILICPLPLKNLCADVVAKDIDNQLSLPKINSHKRLRNAYTKLNSIALFQQLTASSHDIHELIAKAFQKLHSSELLLWNKTLKGHDGRGNSIAYSPDGTQLAPGSNDKNMGKL